MDNVRVILQALKENQFDLAQRTADSEVTKNPESDVYLSLKFLVASRRNDSRLALETAQRAVAVCSKKTLEMFLVPDLLMFGASDLLSTAFVRVNRQNPTDSEVCDLWLESSLHLGDLSSAQKALMAMQRTTKNPRSACFQACFVMALDNSNPKLFPMLAERMIEKHLPAQTAQECYVVAHVRKMVSLEKMVAYLQEPSVFDSFVTGSLDLQVMLLDALTELKLWPDILSYAKRQLQCIDSYNYWQALNTACVELHKEEESQKLSDELTSNNALLSKVDLAVKMGDKEALKVGIAGYWQRNASKPSTYSYLKSVIDETTIKLVEPSPDSLGAKINFAKFSAHIGKPLSLTALFEIYEQHKTEVPAEKTDYFIGTDALILAAQSILREQGPNAFVNAASVLTYALVADPHNFYVRLLLIQIYQQLGLFNLAIKHFDTLSIRNIQFETLGYLMSTRSGTISPDEARHFLVKLRIAHQKAQNFGVLGMTSLTDESFTQFEGVFNLGRHMRLSLDHALVILEQIRTARCSRGSIDYLSLHTIPNEAPLYDNRDMEVVSIDDGQSSLLDTMLIGPKQGDEYVRLQKQKEMAYQGAIQQISGYELKLEDLTEAVNSSTQLTQIEGWNILAVASMVSEGKNAKIPPPPEYDTSKPLGWELYHWCYTTVETIKIARSLKISLGFDIRKVQNWASKYQSELNVWEANANAAFRESGLPGDNSKIVRAIKQEHIAKLKKLLEIR